MKIGSRNISATVEGLLVAADPGLSLQPGTWRNFRRHLKIASNSVPARRRFAREEQ